MNFCIYIKYIYKMTGFREFYFKPAMVVQKRLSGPTFYIVFALLKAILGLFWGN